MELINQHTKKIMEGCKERARKAGLKFQDETLEYIVTNRDLLELSPKIMIPTLYDYWVHDVEVLKEKGKYELYPSNPYETVINTRPAISFYNDNNPDWLNVMIFYHVLGHIDFFQNNLFFRQTWDYDFTGSALSDKRHISRLRSEKGRWVDYIIEFARGIDNIVSYHHELSELHKEPVNRFSNKIDYYFDVFIQKEKKYSVAKYIKEVERYNKCIQKNKQTGETEFFSKVEKDYPEFKSLFKKYMDDDERKSNDLLQFLINNSEFINKPENKWMQSVLEVVRKTSIFFQPQIRTKIMNEGWASYWHETLFLTDDRIKGHEVEFARVNAGVTSMPRVGLNPYALGMRMFYYIEELANKGKYSFDFFKILDSHQRKKYDASTNKGREFIFKVRENLSDFTFITNFLDQDFLTKHNIFVAGKRMNQAKMVWEYYVKSKKVEDYRKMILDTLYHPPRIEIDLQKTKNRTLYLVHKFEEKPLVKEYIQNTMMGIEYLWGGPVQLETSEAIISRPAPTQPQQAITTLFYPGQQDKPEKPKIRWQRVVYTMYEKKLTKRVI